LTRTAAQAAVIRVVLSQGAPLRTRVERRLPALSSLTVAALTTDTLIAAAKKVMDLLPETASEVNGKLMDLAREMDRKRGVIWPIVGIEHMQEQDAGFNWHVFPNSIIEPGISCGLGLRLRPHGHDPDSCIFEAHALERFPPGEAPTIENIHDPQENWPLLWVQDFENLPDVQRGMKCSGRQAVRPNPVMEEAIINLHRNLAKFMSVGAPN
jgi:hypothetical protein